MRIKLNYLPRFDDFDGKIRQEEYLALRDGAIVDIADEAGQQLIDMNLVTEVTEEDKDG
jgi:hypothetical protein